MLGAQPGQKRPRQLLFGQVLTKGLQAVKHVVEGKGDPLVALMNGLAG